MSDAKNDPTNDKSKSYCVYPFVHVATTPKGQYRLCCEAEPFDESVATVDLPAWWTSEKMQKIRSRLTSGEFVPECSACHKKEAMGLLSKRTRLKPEYKDFVVDYEKPILQSLDIRPGNTCNLTCVTCNSEYSSKIHQENKRTAALGEFPSYIQTNLSPENWDASAWAKIMEMAPNFSEIYITGGEPFLMKEFIPLLAVMPKHSQVRLNTNLSIYNQAFIDQLKKFDYVDIGASIDAIGDRLHFMRYPNTMEMFNKHILKLREDLPRAIIGLNFTLSSFNIDQIVPLYQYAKMLVEQNVHVFVTLNKISGPDHMSTFNVPLSKRLKIAEKLEQYGQRNADIISELSPQGIFADIVEFLRVEREWPEKHVRNGKHYLEYLKKHRQVKDLVYSEVSALLEP